MQKGVDISKNSGLSSIQEIMSICNPLYELLEITYFNYVKLFPDGSRSILTDRADFILQYYACPELYQTQAVLNMENINVDKIFLSCEFIDQRSYQVARNDFDIDHGLTIIQPNDNYLELYYFGTKKENYTYVETYKNNIDLFYRFIVYFKEKANKLIWLADKDKFTLPGITKAPPSNHLDINIKRIRKAFLDSTRPTKVFTKGKNSLLVALTYREAEVMYYLTRYSTAKRVANRLNISHRTVEGHLSAIKGKLAYNNKHELIEFLKGSVLGKELNHCLFEE